MSGGDLVADALARQRVPFLFTLCGGHISPILVAAKRRGIRVVDVRDEASAVFAADAVARLTGTPGVAAVTAGPGATNAVTAVKNARLAQSPVVILAGGAPTVLRGRGALQDIDQRALMKPHVKLVRSVRRLRHLPLALEQAFRIAREGVPGPVFVECPADLLYDEAVVREWYGASGASDGGARGGGLAGRVRRWYLARHLDHLFAGAAPSSAIVSSGPSSPTSREPAPAAVGRAARLLATAARPVLLIGSQATLRTADVADLAEAVSRLGVPVYLSGMARGLLGPEHPLLLRHRRREALREADLVLLAGVPCDFRLGYGRHLGRHAAVVSANLSRRDLTRNRRPSVAVLGDPSRFVRELSTRSRPAGSWGAWLATLRARDATREVEITRLAAEETEHVNPLALCRAVDAAAGPDAVLVADGGDFVATASYVVAPRRPLGWLDPGVFGTLGVGGGFALGAKLCRPEAEVWILWGDGSAAMSLAEFDTFVRHGVPVIAVVGNDAAWTQIARDQVPILGDDVGTVLRRTDYERVAEGYGGCGFRVDRGSDLPRVLQAARESAAAGRPALVNVMIGRTAFRSGSISM